jgi:hypothetical protein
MMNDGGEKAPRGHAPADGTQTLPQPGPRHVQIGSYRKRYIGPHRVGKRRFQAARLKAPLAVKLTTLGGRPHALAASQAPLAAGQGSGIGGSRTGSYDRMSATNSKVLHIYAPLKGIPTAFIPTLLPLSSSMR